MCCNPVLNLFATRCSPSLTPRKTATGGGSTKVAELRSQMGYEMDEEFVTCDIDSFMKHYLPFVPAENDVTRCVNKHLKPKGVMIMNKSRKGLVFSKFRETPVINANVIGQRSEMEIYTPLADIAKNIGHYVFQPQADDKPTPMRNRFNYRNVYNNTIKSNIEGSNHRNDGCFTSDEGNFLSTWGIAVPIEQKIKTTNKDRLDVSDLVLIVRFQRLIAVQNVEKILSANVQIMNDDVRRMFTYGVSFELFNRGNCIIYIFEDHFRCRPSETLVSFQIPLRSF